MFIEDKLKKGDFVLISKGIESVDDVPIKFREDVTGVIHKVDGEYAKVNVTFPNQSIALDYRLKDLKRYKQKTERFLDKNSYKF